MGMNLHFLVKPDTTYRFIIHRLDARKLLPVSDKPEVLISDVGRSSTRLQAVPEAIVWR